MKNPLIENICSAGPFLLLPSKSLGRGLGFMKRGSDGSTLCAPALPERTRGGRRTWSPWGAARQTAASSATVGSGGRLGFGGGSDAFGNSRGMFLTVCRHLRFTR